MSLRHLASLLAAAALALGLCATGPAAAGPTPGKEVLITTDRDGALDLARRALAQGRPDLAASIARQMLARSPDDPAPHLILAAALTRMGQARAGYEAARQGFRLGKDKAARFEGAYLAAEALAAGHQGLAAKLWLRRADFNAPTPEHEKLVAYAYRKVAARSRLSFDLALFGGPSENVNGGSLHDTFWFYGIPIPITEALPGQVWGTSAGVSYQLTPRLRARLGWSHAEVVLGDRALAIDPTARAGDYRQDNLTFGLSHVWQDQEGRWAVLSDLTAGRRWKGGYVSADHAGLRVELRHAVSPDWSASARLTVEATEIPDRPVADSVTTRLSLLASRRDTGLGSLTFGAGYVDQASEAAGVAWRGPTLELGWRPPIRSDRFGLQLDLAAESRSYWRSPGYDPDLWLSLQATVELPAFEVMGFEPSVTLSATRTFSDVVVRDTQELGVTLGVSSQF